MNKQDVEGEKLLHPEGRVPSNEDQNSNNIDDLPNDLPDIIEHTIDEDLDDDNEDNRIASRTRSKKRIVVTLNATQLKTIANKADNRNIMSLMTIPTTMFFVPSDIASKSFCSRAR